MDMLLSTLTLSAELALPHTLAAMLQHLLFLFCPSSQHWCTGLPHLLGINQETLCYFLQHRNLIWYRHLRPDRAPNAGRDPLPEQGSFPCCYLIEGPKYRWPAGWVSQTCLIRKIITLLYREDPLHLKPTWQHPQLNLTGTPMREEGPYQSTTYQCILAGL